MGNYFDTLPMGIVEVSDSSARYVRCNHAFRDFMRRMFSLEPEALETVLGSFTEENRLHFIQTLNHTYQSGAVSVMDQKMPDGSVVHFLLRPLAANSVSGYSALAVAVLSVEKPEEGVSYSQIALALELSRRSQPADGRQPL